MTPTSKQPQLTNPDYWVKSREGVVTSFIPNDRFSEYLCPLLPINPAWTCLEVGVLPGRLLLWFATEFGYQPCGVDFLSKVHGLSDLFQQHGIKGEFFQADFLKWEAPHLFDVVTSFGFVEHFTNYHEVLERKWTLVKPGGYLVTSMPCWSPVQELIRRLLYTREHYKNIREAHNVEIVHLAPLKSAIARLEGVQIVYAAPISHMKVWFKLGDPGVRPRRGLFRLIRFFEKCAHKLNWSNTVFSPEVLVVARKLD